MRFRLKSRWKILWGASWIWFQSTLGLALESPFQHPEDLPTLFGELPETTEETLFSGFAPHKPNYLLPCLWLANPDRASTSRERCSVKFQISVKHQPVRRIPVFLAYTQKSFWEAYDRRNSRPFRETNYNPEILGRLRFKKAWGAWGADGGLEHESNGAHEPNSRSWNRFYLTPHGHYRLAGMNEVGIDWKIWWRLPEQKKRFPEDPEGDENPEIEKFYGHQEVRVQWKHEDYLLAVLGRWNPLHRHGAMQIDLSGPVPQSTLFWLLQYWDGFGESLIDYDRSLTRWGMGLIFTR